MRFVAFIVLVLALWFGLKQLGIGPDKSDDTAKAASRHSEGYLELRARFTVGSDEFDMVFVESKPLLDDCKDTERGRRLVETCPTDIECELLRFECKNEIEDKYRRLLDREQTHLYYAHADIKDSGPARNAAMVVWGMTVEGSQEYCRQMIGSPEWRSRKGATLSCVPAR